MSAYRLLTPQEVADLRSMSVDALRKERERGRGPAWIQTGRRIRYSPQAVRDYLNRNTVFTADAPPPTPAPQATTTTTQPRRGQRPRAPRIVTRNG